MKVLVLAENSNMGGINRYCINLVQGMRQLGVEISLMAPERCSNGKASWLVQECSRKKLNVRLLTMSHIFDLSVIFRLRRILEEEQINIIHLQGYHSNIIGRLATRKINAQVALVTTAHGIPVGLTDFLRLHLYHGLDMLTSCWTQHFIAVDEGSKEYLFHHGVPLGKISVIHNGVNLPDVSMLATNAKERHKIVVGFVGRLSPEKGVDYLLEIIEKTLSVQNNIRFVIVGDGPDKHLLTPFLRTPFEKHVTLVGQKSQVEPLYLQMDLFVMPSRSEGLPFVALEAMSYGIPVIATAVGGLPEVINNGKDGILISTHNVVPAMAEAIIDLATHHEKRITLGKAARQTVEGRFSRRIMCQNTLRIYESVLRSSTR